ncbi:MAG TPA: cob(I)yrinic acid a,c-diamide adenosyltransferase [Polyangiaceae bacterium]|nr:cob(I)yrinic acid a,c-diamide adenosyltransferase [Polyangiaceae bacterium]
MKIYTRTGDDGSTGLYGGSRLGKDDPRVEAYGTVDELNAWIGEVRSLPAPEGMDGWLEQIQADLFVIGAELACPSGAEERLGLELVDKDAAEQLERWIDTAEEGLAPLRSFILPGGTRAAASLHVARTVARRAERAVLRASRHAPIRGELIVYLNRLSDLLFTLARRANHLGSVPDTPWSSGPRR